MMRVGVEVGGTFTDLIAIGPDGLRVAKVPSVPKRPDEGRLRRDRAAGVEVSAIEELVHGSTVATNTVIERSGARVAMVFTRGFRDLLLLQRQDRLRSYDVAYRKPEPIAPRRACFEAAERMLSDGTCRRGLWTSAPSSRNSCRASLPAGSRRSGFAFSMRTAIRRTNSGSRPCCGPMLPGVGLVLSSDLNREFREYERASTTAIAALVQPVLAAYVERLESWLSRRSFAGPFHAYAIEWRTDHAAGDAREPGRRAYSRVPPPA